MKRKPRPLMLRRASAYYRLAAKAMKAGEWASASHYGKLADRLVAENRRQQASLGKWAARQAVAAKGFPPK
jgi:hypothetical protein